MCLDYQFWFRDQLSKVGFTGLSELILSLVGFEFAELLCGDEPPTYDQLLELEKRETGKFYAVYICLVESIRAGDDPQDANTIHDIFHYVGSSTDQTKGFPARRRKYTNRCISSSPAFIVKMMQEGIVFDVTAVLPIVRVDHVDADHIEFGDMRVPVVFIETVMMMWWRSLLPDSAWEKLMAYSPWAAGTTEFVRTNRVVSTKFEYPGGKLMTPERVEAKKTYELARRAARKAKLTPEEREVARLEQNAYELARRAARKAELTPEEREVARLEQNAYQLAITAAKKATLTPEEREAARLEQNAYKIAWRAANKATLTPEEEEREAAREKAVLTPEEQEAARLEKNASENARRAARKAELTPEEREAARLEQNAKNNTWRAAKKATLTPEEREAARLEQNARRAAEKAALTPEEREVSRLEQNAYEITRRAIKKATLTPEEREAARLKRNAYQNGYRAAKKSGDIP